MRYDFVPRLPDVFLLHDETVVCAVLLIFTILLVFNA